MGLFSIDVIHLKFLKNFVGVPSCASKSADERDKNSTIGRIMVIIFKYWFCMMSLGYLNIVKNCVNYQINKEQSDYWENGVNYELSRRRLAYIWGEHLFFFHARMCGPVSPLC